MALGFSAIGVGTLGDSGYETQESPPPSGTIDAAMVPASRTVSFTGGARIIPFDGGTRVVSFEGSIRVVTFEGQ